VSGVAAGVDALVGCVAEGMDCSVFAAGVGLVVVFAAGVGLVEPGNPVLETLFSRAFVV